MVLIKNTLIHLTAISVLVLLIIVLERRASGKQNMSNRIFKTQICGINRGERKKLRAYINLLHEVCYLKADTEMDIISGFMFSEDMKGKVKCFTDYGITYAYPFKHNFPSKADLLAEKKAQEKELNNWEEEY